MVVTDMKNKYGRAAEDNSNSKISLQDGNIGYDTIMSNGNKHFRTHSSMYGRSNTPSSIVSIDSDIRFTRKFNYQYKSGCCILATILTTILFVSVLLYIAYNYFKIEPGGEQQFRGMFTIIEGDIYSKDLSDSSSGAFKLHASQYVKMINNVIYNSRYRFSFLNAEVLAFDGEEFGNLTVFFSLKFNPRWQNIKTDDISAILRRQPFPGNQTVDENSVFVEESTSLKSKINITRLSSSDGYDKAEFYFINQNSHPPPRCVNTELPYCFGVTQSNYTSYPNLMGHQTIQDVNDDLIAYRELIDAECFQHALEFICYILQPVCMLGGVNQTDDEVILPCKAFCQEFWSGCGSRMPERFQNILNCDRFPDQSDVGVGCNKMPAATCHEGLANKGFSWRICDGIVDCTDMADEISCPYCHPGYLHCGIGKKCISISSYCDGINDCPDASDERNCLFLIPNSSLLDGLQSTHSSYTFQQGYVMFTEHGITRKVCASNITGNSKTEDDLRRTLYTLGNSFCQSSNYKKVVNITITEDEEETINYVNIQNPTSADFSLVQSECPNREVLYITCSENQCGKQLTRNSGNLIDGLNKMATPGDWPWHAALFRDGVHVCDATLISQDWLLTTISCFQGQNKAEWIAKFGVIRLNSKIPWQQQKHIIGMVKSPVEGSMLAMVKLSESIEFSDFVWPICLPTNNFSMKQVLYCNTLGWAENRETLQRIEVKEVSMENCANVSIMMKNGLCADSVYGQNDCEEEELAGSPMACILNDTKAWTLVGISNWRIACSMIGMQRPRLYDQITSNIRWIKNTMAR